MYQQRLGQYAEFKEGIVLDPRILISDAPLGTDHSGMDCCFRLDKSDSAKVLIPPHLHGRQRARRVRQNVLIESLFRHSVLPGFVFMSEPSTPVACYKDYS